MRGKVTKLLEKALDENPSLFLIDFSITENNKIRVILDGDSGVTVENCMAISRAIEHNLDREEEDFSLEVMSAGVSEPLKITRQYKKNIGRNIKVKTLEGSVLEGNLTDVNDETFIIKWKTREPKPVGKGKITVQKEAQLHYDEISEAKVMIKFN